MIDGQLDLLAPPPDDEPAAVDDLSDLEVPPPPPDDNEERLAQLLAEFPVDVPATCRCERSIVATDEYDDARCWRCGHAPWAPLEVGS